MTEIPQSPGTDGTPPEPSGAPPWREPGWQPGLSEPGDPEPGFAPAGDVGGLGGDLAGAGLPPLQPPPRRIRACRLVLGILMSLTPFDDTMIEEYVRSRRRCGGYRRLLGRGWVPALSGAE